MIFATVYINRGKLLMSKPGYNPTGNNMETRPNRVSELALFEAQGFYWFKVRGAVGRVKAEEDPDPSREKHC
jgi:hypothetical protein